MKAATISHHDAELEELRADRELAVEYLKAAMESLDSPDDRAAGLLALRTIAEGYERGTNKDFIPFLKIAQGSSAELRTQTYIAHSIGTLEKQQMSHIVEECKRIGAMLQALAKARGNSASEPDFHEAEGEAFELDVPEPGTRKPEPEVLTEPGTRKPETVNRRF